MTPTHSQPGTFRRRIVSAKLRQDYPRERPCIHCTGNREGLVADLDGTEFFTLTTILSPDRPARRNSLCRLSYPSCRKIVQNYSKIAYYCYFIRQLS